MAVVEGPLHSTNARGTIFGTNTHYNWKGLHVVRNRVSPVQPRSAAVMNLRIKLKALGKVSKVFSTSSTLSADMKLVTPARKPWNAYWIGVAIKQYIVDNTDYDIMWAEWLGLDPAIRANWDTEADDCGLLDVTLEVEGHAADHPATFTKAFAVYMLAKACYFMEVLDESDVKYTNPSGWAAPAIAAFGARIID